MLILSQTADLLLGSLDSLAHDVQLINFFIKRKIFHCWDVQIFVFLWNPEMSNSVTSSKALLHNGNYASAYFFLES